MSGVGRAELTERALSDAGRPLRAQTQKILEKAGRVRVRHATAE